MIDKFNLLDDAYNATFFTGHRGTKPGFMYIGGYGDLFLNGKKSDYSFKYYEAFLTDNLEWDGDGAVKASTAYVKSLASMSGSTTISTVNDNLNDGTDVSWIWDADYESLFAEHRYARIGVFGIRAQDMRLRLKYAGAPDASIEVYATLDELAEAVEHSDKPVCVLPNYTSMLSVRDKLSVLAGGGKFWEAN